MNSDRRKILLVDDMPPNLVAGQSLLKHLYDVYPASSVAGMFAILESIRPDLILLDVAMPDVDGYAALGMLKEKQGFADIPVIFLTAMSDEESELKGFNLGAVDYVSKPFSPPLLLKRIEHQLLILQQKEAILRYTKNLEEMVGKKVMEVCELQNAVMDAVIDMMEFRDKSVGGHSSQTKQYMIMLIDALRGEPQYAATVSAWDMNIFLSSVQLHDVGKIAIPDAILNKPDKLTSAEFEIMKTHVTVGVEAIKRIMGEISDPSFMRYALPIVGAHHEKWDGTGYPAGLKGEEIPLEGRLMAFADVYDALVSSRPYKQPYTHGEAVEIMLRGSGSHFDPSLMKIFLSVESDFNHITHERVGAQTVILPPGML